MGTLRLPLVLLAGRDRRPAAGLPEEGREQHRLKGYKAMEVEIAGRPLIAHLLERLRASRAFDPIFLAGPERVYGALAGEVRLVDTDGDFGDNIRAGVEAVTAAGFEAAAVATSDVLPDPQELTAAVDDLERHRPWDFWMLQCRVHDRRALGTSAWKPEYLIVPEGEREAVATVPGHLVAADLKALRLDILYELLELAYRTRNQPVGPRRSKIVRGFLSRLLREDLHRLVTLRRPGVSWDMLWHCLIVVRKLATTGCPQREMEDRLRRVFVRWGHRRRHPERRARVMVADLLSFGRDIDTEEEAREIAHQLEEDA